MVVAMRDIAAPLGGVRMTSADHRRKISSQRREKVKGLTWTSETDQLLLKMDQLLLKMAADDLKVHRKVRSSWER